jgi:DNA-binding NarL/FixJ family response regulator
MPESITFSPEGLLVDDGVAYLDGPVRTLLRRAVVCRERIRARGETLWPAFVAGEWTLVDRFEKSGRRVVVAHRNARDARRFQILSAPERTALLQALDGIAGKVTALELGVSEATVSRFVSRALRRLGLKSLAEAAALRRMTVSIARIGDGPAATELAVLRSSLVVRGSVGEKKLSTLTLAERRVLTAVLEGRAQKDIAAERLSSPRTIANQVASIFRKLGVGSRRELMARILGPDGPQRVIRP